MRYGFLALGLLGGCTTNETTAPSQIVETESTGREARSLNFSEIASDYQDNLFATIGERLRNYREDEDVTFDKGVRSSFFPRKGGGKLQTMKIRSDRVIFEYSDDVRQSVPGYDGLTLTASRRLAFSYQVRGSHVVMDRIEGEIKTGYSNEMIKLLASPILAEKGIDPEIDIKRIIIGEFEGRNPAAFIADPDKKRFAVLDLVKRDFLEPTEGYEQYDSVGIDVVQETNK